ncbi:MAG: ATP-binding protein [Thermoguttaceae bacterium]
MQIFFFRHRDSDDYREIAAVEDSVLAENIPSVSEQAKTSQSVHVFPHLYDISERDKVIVETLKSCPGPITVYSWLPSRAAFWTLRKLGVTAELTCHEIGSEQKINIPDVSQSKSENRRWYPVIDYDKCVGCLECVNYCLFGVYIVDANAKPLVEQPDSCRDGCPACARVCPGKAIMFPEYNDPVISGRLESVIPDPLDELIDSV